MKVPVFVGLLLLLIAPAQARAQDADSAWAAGAHDLAERLYGARLAADSSDVTALRRIATLRAWAGRYDDAIALFDRAVRIAPADAALALERARVLAWDRRYGPAIEAIDAVLAREPANREALVARAQFTSWAGRYDESLTAYGRLLEISPADPALMVARARVLGWARRYDQAAANFEEMLRADPGNRELVLGLAQVLSWGGRADSASAIFRRMLERDPADLDALKGLARAASWSGELRAGERYWRRVLEVAPQDVEGLTGLGANLRWQGRDAAALTVLERAYAIDATNTDVRMQLDYAAAAVAPRFAPAYTAESDSDRNRMLTATASASFRPRAALETRVSAYHRTLRGFDLDGENRTVASYGATAGATLQLEPGWTATALLGASRAGDSDADPLLNLRAAVATPRWFPVTAALTYNRAAFDYTTALAARGVRSDQLMLDAGTRLSARANVNGSVSTTRFKGRERNRQVAATLATTYRVSTPVTLGLAARTFAFEKDRTELLEGYFNPDRYGMLELTAATYHERGKLMVTSEVAPGVQQIGSDGDPTASFRATVRTAWSFTPGRQLGVSAAYANSGLQQLSGSGNAGYDYRAFSVFGTWTLATPRR